MTTTTFGSNPVFRSARFGLIKQIHPDNQQVSVDFEDNPAGEPVWASIGRAFSRAQINLAIDNQLECKITFMNSDPSLPILRDIFFSYLDKRELVIKAEKVVLEGSKSVTLQSNKASTHYDGRSGRVTTKAQYITSQAEKTQKIKARKIDLN
ncbi:hypothetical protein GTG28_01760 [Vibrio sp. OCN044]|uniref:Uncharacterized protein n=1 Tax=Vibrio tetraodonis subsp. pristinus TaxID=2695891 RepID=A0A6L8LPN2_9VIBR|nr:hypothetical protein [Vibrio tetraodonis]MYM57938.1 hypothetical protein [Vibrio tetraodonis subsp. pristinus]